MISAKLESPDGTTSRKQTAAYTIAPGASQSLQPYPEHNRLVGDIALLRAEIRVENSDTEPIGQTAIVGTPRPHKRGQDALIGMNVHLHRYTSEEQWRLLRMMRDAGVTTVRIEPGFHAPDEQGRFSIPQKFDEALLAAEAFGMTPLMALTFFPQKFYDDPAKAAMAYGWAKAVGERYKGRVFDYQYGNETNAGWAAYGAAADMAVHNQAMALGTLAADPSATPATLGVAEALPNYLSELFRYGLSPYVRAVTLHPYCGTPEAGIAKTLANRRIIREYGRDQEIWLTEIGFHVSDPGSLNPVTQELTLTNGFTIEQQAAMIARLFILGRSHAIQRIYWYNFYGKQDRETFWLVDADFNPRPAYHALKHTSAMLANATPLGGTSPREPIQKHLFRKADGSVFLVAWSLRDNTPAILNLPRDSAQKCSYPTRGILGDENTYDFINPITLGTQPLFITNIPQSVRSFDQLEVLANSVDARTWSSPMQRWSAEPGGQLSVPCTVFNSGRETITAYPVLLNRYPDWTFELPAPFAVEPGQSVTRQIKISIPSNTIPGVEYRPSFAIETMGPQRTMPFEARIWINGFFPYAALLAEPVPSFPQDKPDYLTRRIIDESRVGFGRATLHAKHAEARIDGDLSDWSPSEFVTLDQVAQWKLRDAGRPMREDWFARVALRWDKTHLYLAYIALDNDLSLLDLTSRDWRDSDNLRLFLSTLPENERAKNITENDLLLFMTPTRQFHDEAPAIMTASLGGYIRSDFEKHVTIASRIWHGGYLIETSIPFASLGLTPSLGLELGCNILSDDADDGYRRFTGMTMFRNLNYWNSPQSLGTLRLGP